jgi:putative peptidoglycan lipid II flippase
MMVPHSIVTVSLATAILPRISGLAHEGRLGDLGRELGATLRTSLALVLPFAVLLPVIAPDVANTLWGWGAGRTSVPLFVPSLALFGPALVFFTVHYLMLRGFYALEQTRLVFLIQCAISATNIVAAVWLVSRTTPDQTAPSLVLAWLASYVVGSAISYTVLHRTLGGLDTARLVRFLVRMVLVAAVAVAVAWAATWLMSGWGEQPYPLVSALRAGIASALGGGVLLVGARVLHVEEVTSLVDTVTARLRR